MNYLLFSFLPLLVGVAKASEIHGHEKGIVIEHSEAGEHIHGSHIECPLPKVSNDVVQCAKEEHPLVKRAKLKAQASETLTGVARQIPNPNLDVRSGFGNSSSNRSETEVSLVQSFELGGKRSARIHLAEAEQNQTVANLKAVQADIIIETIVKLHRIRQLEREREILESTVNALTLIISQQRSRPALSPEGKASLSVYKMALADAKVKQSELFEEERAIEHYFHVSTGHSLEELKKVLPEAPKVFPQIGEAPKEVNSPDVLRVIAEKKSALAELDAAQAKSWPTLSIGPSAIFEESDLGSESLFGFKLMMNLPVFQANGAGRAHALRGVERSDHLIEIVRAEEAHERAEQLRVYKSAVEVLKEAPTISEIKKSHQENESLAKRGLISASLLIESHRQRMDLIKGLFGRELKAIEALWEIRKFDGDIFEETL